MSDKHIIITWSDLQTGFSSVYCKRDCLRDAMNGDLETPANGVVATVMGAARQIFTDSEQLNMIQVFLETMPTVQAFKNHLMLYYDIEPNEPRPKWATELADDYHTALMRRATR